MNTLSRLNLLFLACHMPPVGSKAMQLSTTKKVDEHLRYLSPTPVHDLIDLIDKHSGIITRFTVNGSLAPVGERLRRLERHLKAREQPPYFFLGAGAEPTALTG